MKSNGSFWHKTKEIAIEIGIIVFAVSLSIWLHGLSERNHDRHDAKLFLEGLKADLQHDIREMHIDLGAYRLVAGGVAYFKKVAYGEPLNIDSLNAYKSIFVNTTIFNPNESRFEGLKATGRLSIIENKKLLENILYFYQEDVPTLFLLNTSFTNYKVNHLFVLLDEKLKVAKDESGNWEEVLHQPEFQNALRRINYTNEIIRQYERTIKMAGEIIVAIDTELE